MDRAGAAADSPGMTAPYCAAPGAIWIARPWVDLVVGCGGWSLPLLAVSYTLSSDSARDWAGAFYAAGAVRQLPALHGHGVSRLRRRRSLRAPPLHRLRHRRADRARRGRPRRPAAAAGPVHRLRDVESLALHRPELRAADDVRPARRPDGVAGAGPAAEAGVRRVVRDAAGRRSTRGRRPIRRCCRWVCPPR